MRLLLVFLAACGGASAVASEPVEHHTDLTGEVHVYAWDGEELVALFCFARGALEVSRCAWSETLELPLDPPVSLSRRVHDRVVMDDSTEQVTSYGRGSRMPRLVIESDAGYSIWTGDEPQLVLDRSGVELLPVPNLIGAVRPKDERPPPEPAFMVMGYHAYPIAAVDLDADSAAEVIYLSDDDGGDFVAAEELSIDDGFRAHVGH